MTQNQVINKLALELAFQTGRMEDMKLYKQYLRMALVVGTDHFLVGMKEIVAMDKEGKELGRFRCIKDVAKKLNLRYDSIEDVLQKRRNSVFGYKFIYAIDMELKERTEKMKILELEPANNREYHGYREHNL
jgi:hypothetical protein